MIPSFKTQVLIDKKHDTIVFESMCWSHYAEKGKSFTFNTNVQVCYCSLVLGILKIKEARFLMFADQVYQQPPLPPKGFSVYQIASVDYISFKSQVHKE